MNIETKVRESTRLESFINEEKKRLQVEMQDFDADCETVKEWRKDLDNKIN